MVSQRASQDCYCQKYLGLLSENARLREEAARLRARLSRQDRTAREEPFGLSTPSSQRLVKPSLPAMTEEEARRRRGGAPAGRAGHGWRTPGGAEPVTEDLPAPDACPCCGGALEDFPGGAEDVRDLIDCHPLPAFRRRVRVPARYCPRCRKPVRPRVPGVLPKTRLTNNVLARAASEHYLDGVPMGTAARRLGVPKGTLLNGMHRLAALARPAADGLRGLLRDAAVKHADETPWRTDGDNGYAWVFVAERVRLFACEQTRAMSVPDAVFAGCGGTLVTDRYAGYNPFAGSRNFCFEDVANAPARHPSVQHIQDIFRENAARLWRWTEDPRVPDKNNAAERAVRPLAIARKVSHGSQSVRGRETRSVLMSVLHTLSACCTDPAGHLTETLDRYAEDPATDMFARIFGGLPLYIPTQ